MRVERVVWVTLSIALVCALALASVVVASLEDEPNRQRQALAELRQTLDAARTPTPAPTIVGFDDERSSVFGSEPIAAHPNVSATTVETLEPFAADGTVDPRYSSVGTARGECYPSNVLLLRDDTLRCFADSGAISDPCFASPISSEVALCLVTPWDTAPLQMHIDALGDPHSDWEPEDPPVLEWAIELTNGQRCVLVSGATAAKAGVFDRYICNGPRAVVGDAEGGRRGFDRTEPVWAIRYMDDDDCPTLDDFSDDERCVYRWMGVATVWR